MSKTKPEPTPDKTAAVPAVRHRVVVPIQTRGGIGKSTEAIARACWMDQRDVDWQGFDLDAQNRTFSDNFPKEAALVQLSQSEPEGDIIKVLRKATFKEVTAIDPQAHMNQTILQALRLIQFPKTSAPSGVRLTVLVYPMDEVTDMDDITSTVDALGEYGGLGHCPQPGPAVSHAHVRRQRNRSGVAGVRRGHHDLARVAHRYPHGLEEPGGAAGTRNQSLGSTWKPGTEIRRGSPDGLGGLEHGWESLDEIIPRADIPKNLYYLCMTQYDKSYALPLVIFPESMDNLLANVLGNAQLRNLRVAETEKYAHVTYFFNGGIETPFPGEDRTLIQSKKVATYDLAPEMSAEGIGDTIVAAIHDTAFDLVIANFANADMVGHSGQLLPTIKAVEYVDVQLGRIYKALRERGGSWLITADHGNAEQMIDPTTGGPHTAHTTNPVPMIYVAEEANQYTLRPDGSLRDISPTLINLLGLHLPKEMTGNDLRLPISK